MIDILFVHSNASAKIYQGLATNNAAIEPPIWAAMLANSVRSIGYEAQILDAEAERIDYLETAKRINEYDARVICFVVYGQQPSASSQNMEGACQTALEFAIITAAESRDLEVVEDLSAVAGRVLRNT